MAGKVTTLVEAMDAELWDCFPETVKLLHHLTEFDTKREREAEERKIKEDQSYVDQLATINTVREQDGKPPLSMSRFMSGVSDEGDE